MSRASTPAVSFVVPCYKLAHLLKDCIDSILTQTYCDFEILIMDDKSPDHTKEVAQSFGDSRVIYIGNEENLGHLRNYNKGIELARGRYIWMISADDRLRTPYILERYVQTMDAHPSAGFAYCPGVELKGSVETRILPYSVHWKRDAVLPGHVVLEKLLQGNSILAPAGMVRREAYKKVGLFPLDLPYSGDWYLWAMFAMHFDVAYFAEPMVNYRKHELAITETLIQRDIELLINNDFMVLQRIRDALHIKGCHRLVKKCDAAISHLYGELLAAARSYRGTNYRLSRQKFAESLRIFFANRVTEACIRGQAFAVAGDYSYWRGEISDAREFYQLALSERRFLWATWIKSVLLNSGKTGIALRGLKMRWRSWHPVPH